ncbi:hypothetical protein NQ315_000143, partial [Exocentrus adspersus]
YGVPGVSAISREPGESDLNGNSNRIVKKRKVFRRQRWVLRINGGDESVATRLKIVAYVLVTCSVVLAVCFGIFFAIYKNKHKASENKIIQVLQPITSTPNIRTTPYNEIQTTPEATETTGESTTLSSTSYPICGSCSAAQVCLKLEETEAPKCIETKDRNDPTGCGGWCPINTHYCQTLDVKGKVYQCSPSKRALLCLNNNFNCGNMCVSQEKRCDGAVHCSNMSDEVDCDTHFHCGNSTSCLDKSKKCDRKVDCWDKSDEINCTKAVFCSTEEIPCTSGQCVPKDNFCDGKFDCSDQTDEPEGCQI